MIDDNSAEKPVPPEKPLATDCCETGCEICVFDSYAKALLEYKKKLKKWQDKQPG